MSEVEHKPKRIKFPHIAINRKDYMYQNDADFNETTFHSVLANMEHVKIGDYVGDGDFEPEGILVFKSEADLNLFLLQYSKEYMKLDRYNAYYNLIGNYFLSIKNINKLLSSNA